MPPDNPGFARRYLAGARVAWPLFLATTLLAVVVGYHLAPRAEQPLPPQFAFTSNTTTIQASGTWKTADNSIPNTTSVFCWFPANSCDVTVSELVPEGSHQRFQVTDKSLDIIQLSDASLTATASRTDPCHIETLHVDRKTRAATLTVGPVKKTACAGTPTQTATLGG